MGQTKKRNYDRYTLASNILYFVSAVWCIYLVARLVMAQWWRIEYEGVVGVYSIIGTQIYALPSIATWFAGKLLGGNDVLRWSSLVLILLIFVAGFLVPSQF